jgi:hypothetical protein
VYQKPSLYELIEEVKPIFVERQGMTGVQLEEVKNNYFETSQKG